jgi:hypothetical protein
MLDPASEIARLRDMLPASWRMNTTIKNSLYGRTVISSTMPQPWRHQMKVMINWNLWEQLDTVERDLLFLREVSWRQNSTWFKLGAYQSIAVASALGAIIQGTQGDVVGTALALLLGGTAGLQVWRQCRSAEIQLEADIVAIQAAERRGYTEITAAKALLSGMTQVAQLEGRKQLSLEELLRRDQLRSIVG